LKEIYCPKKKNIYIYIRASIKKVMLHWVLKARSTYLDFFQWWNDTHPFLFWGLSFSYFGFKRISRWYIYFFNIEMIIYLIYSSFLAWPVKLIIWIINSIGFNKKKLKIFLFNDMITKINSCKIEHLSNVETFCLKLI
jgi:hypothetical protein